MPQIIRFSVFAILAFLGSELSAQLNPIKINIPMRDGKTLAGDLYAKDTTSKRGTILIMTPYGKFYYKLRGLPFGIKFDINKSKYQGSKNELTSCKR